MLVGFKKFPKISKKKFNNNFTKKVHKKIQKFHKKFQKKKSKISKISKCTHFARNPVIECQELVHRPKLVFLQACRGTFNECQGRMADDVIDPCQQLGV